MQHRVTAPCHDRLRLGELANQLGISRRSVIPYENNQHKSPWPRLTVLLRLQLLEEQHEQQLLAHFAGASRGQMQELSQEVSPKSYVLFHAHISVSHIGFAISL